MLPVNNQLTMSHREIAELVDSRPDKVKQSIERLSKRDVITFTPVGELHTAGAVTRNVTNYYVNKRDSYIVVAQLCPEFTARLVDRWQELESQQAPQLPQTYLEALEQLVEKEKKLIEQAPKVAFVDNLVDRTGLMNATQVGQEHKMSAVRLNKNLDEFGVYNKAVKRGRVFQQWFIDKGYGEMKQTDAGFPQALFTNAGAVWIHEKLTVEGVI